MTYDSEADSAYFYLGGGGVEGEAKVTVPLEELAEAEGLEALQSIFLDFDGEGRLIGVEVLDARRTLNPRILPSPPMTAP